MSNEESIWPFQSVMTRKEKIKETYRIKTKGNLGEAWKCHWTNDGMSDPKEAIRWKAELSFRFKAVDSRDKSLYSCLTEVLEFRPIRKVLKIFVHYKQDEAEVMLQSTRNGDHGFSALPKKYMIHRARQQLLQLALFESVIFKSNVEVQI